MSNTNKQVANTENLPVEIQVITSLERNREKLSEAMVGIQDSLMLSAGDTVRSWSPEKQLNFMDQFAYRVCSDENLAECFTTTEGKRSIIQALRRSLETGLQVGGKHAYLVPQPKVKGGPPEARFSIKAEGYIALLCGGANPIFKDIKWGRVHEEDDYRMDEANGVIEHTHGMTRGKFLGIWVKIVKLTGESQVFSFDRTKIDQWKAQSRTGGAVWNKWPEEMAEQACIRHACSRFEEAKDMLAEAWGAESTEQPDDIAERAANIMPDISEPLEEKPLDDEPISGSDESEETISEEQVDEKEKAAGKSTKDKKAEEEKAIGDLF